MKKLIIGIVVIIALLMVTLLALPVIFKDDIKAAIDQEMDQSLNAKVFYDVDKLDLSLLSHFPSLSVQMDQFGIVGVGPFENDTLVSIGSFEVAVNLFSLFGDNISVDGIYLDRARMNIIILEDGTANYDIAVASEEAPTSASEPGGTMNISIKRWEFKNTTVIYDDRSIPFYMSLQGLQHEGSGDFGSNVFDMISTSSVADLDVAYDGLEYISNKQLNAEVTLGIDLDAMKFTFKENNVRLNDFVMGVDGFLEMPADDIVMDLSFAAKETDFKNVLSLVPGMFLEGFEALKTSGEFQFDARVNGTYNETSMPAFRIALQVSDAMLQYPDLPTAITNINTNMVIDNKDGITDNTTIDISQFHMDLGNNPVDGKLLIKNLVNYDMNADINARLNLAELASMVPMDGLSMKGIFAANLKASGVYDSIAQKIPTINLQMALNDGFIKYDEYPIPMEDIQMKASVTNSTGKMTETLIKVDQFVMLLDGEKMEATLRLENLNDYTWELALHGGVDLEKLLKIFPQEGMQLSGKIKADIDSKGKMSDLEAERYSRLATSGDILVSDLYFKSDDLPQGFKIVGAEASFDPTAIQLSRFDAELGRSDMQVNGAISNYMAYALDENATLEGNFIFKSRKFDLNEWMTDEDASTSDQDTSSLEVIRVPENIAFVLRSNIDEVLYDNLTLTNVKGDIIVRDGAVNLNGVGFNLLEGQFRMNGAYVTKNLDNPEFDFDFGIEGMSIAKSYQAFNMIQVLAPIAQHVTGNFSTDFKMKGRLGQDMMPIYETINGAGLLNVAKAAVKDVKILQQVSSLTKLGANSNLSSGTMADITNLVMSAEIKGGRFFVDPFDINLAGRTANISGSTSLDGGLDYVLSTVIPAGAGGDAVNAALASITGGSNLVGENINLKLAITGTYDNPKVGIAGAQPGAKGAANAAQTAVKAEAKEQLNVQKEKVSEELDTQKKQAETQLKQEQEKLEDKANKEIQEALKDSTLAAPVEEAKDLIKGLLKKKKKEGGQ